MAVVKGISVAILRTVFETETIYDKLRKSANCQGGKPKKVK
jgi:hypothetical protein